MPFVTQALVLFIICLRVNCCKGVSDRGVLLGVKEGVPAERESGGKAC